MKKSRMTVLPLALIIMTLNCKNIQLREFRVINNDNLSEESIRMYNANGANGRINNYLREECERATAELVKQKYENLTVALPRESNFHFYNDSCYKFDGNVLTYDKRYVEVFVHEPCVLCSESRGWVIYTMD